MWHAVSVVKEALASKGGQGELTLTSDASDLAFSLLQTNNKNVHVNIPKPPDCALLCEAL